MWTVKELQRYFRFPEQDKGFSLIEILVSITLIAVGVLGFALNPVGVIQGNYISRNVTIAYNLAQDKMEQIQALATDSPICPSAKLPNCSDSEGPINFQGMSGLPGAIFERSWVITPGTPEAGLSTIEVTLSWSAYQVPRQFTVSTILFTP